MKGLFDVSLDPNEPTSHEPASREPAAAGPREAETPGVAPATRGAATSPGAATFSARPVVPGGPVATAPRRGPSAGLLNAVLVVAVAVAIAGVAFAVGRGTAPAAAAGGDQVEAGNGVGDVGGDIGDPGHSAAPDGSGGAGDRFGLGDGLTVAGTVQSVTGDTLSVITAGGRTIVVTLGSATTYRTAASASAGDVKAGSKVEVQLAFGAEGQPTPSGSGGAPLGTASTVTLAP